VAHGFFVGRVQKTIGTNPMKSFGQRVLKVTPEKFENRQSHGLALPVALVTEGYLIILNSKDARIVNGLTGDITGQVVEKSVCMRDGFFDMYVPFLCWINERELFGFVEDFLEFADELASKEFS
jgi:hypothetical protein